MTPNPRSGPCRSSGNLVVWVSVSRHNKIQPTERLKTVEIYFFRVLGAGSLRSRCQRGLVLGSTLPGLQTAPPLCVLTWPFFCSWMQRGSKLFDLSSHKDINPIRSNSSPPPFWPHITLITSLEAPFPSAAILGAGRASTSVFWGTWSFGLHAC